MFLLFLNSTRVGLIPPNYNHNFESVHKKTVGLIPFLVLLHEIQYYEIKFRFFFFLNSTRVGLIPPNYNNYFEKKMMKN